MERPVGIRERRKARTRAELTAQARMLTVQRGLHGFTVEELCERVGVSRRTFFNYFPTKEDAVVGHADDGLDDDVLAEFRAARPAGCTGISPTLLADLVRMAVEQSGRTGFTQKEACAFATAIHREPQLLARIVHTGPERERAFAELIADREGVAADHPVVTAAVVVFTGLLHRAAARYFQADNTRTHAEILTELLAGTQELFRQDLST